ncbi:glycosyltransferase [Pirellulimonas nuda]|uniref:glycosyltransferase n=1 Tax=Pirellulimonas nuda TaxID=2528009 RepID=UPI0018D2F650|nr:glycosyltransferase [Pirellulimonas nuda]
MLNALPPYQAHFQKRLAEDLPEVRLVVVITHRDRERDWQAEAAQGVEYIDLSDGDPIPARARGHFSVREWRRGSKLIAVLRRLAPAAVIVGGYYDIARIRLLRWCPQAGISTYIWADSNLRGERGRAPHSIWRKRTFIRTITRPLAGCFACGSLGRAFWKFYGVPRSKVFTCPYTPDYGEIEQITPGEVSATRERYDLSESRRWLVYSGRLVSVKRVDLLIDAFASIAAERPDWSLAVAGDGELRDELQARVPQHLAERVRWLGFVNKQHEVSSIYRAADVLVLPSDYEPWALVVNEALAAGLAVVATNVVGAAQELVRDGVNGRKTPPGDAAALADALRDVTDAANIDRYKAASAAVLADWRRDFDPVDGVRRALRAAGVLPEVQTGAGPDSALQ